MLREGFGSAEVDMEQRTLREARVDAERLVLATRSALATDGDLLNADERASIEQRMAELESARAADDVAAIRAALDALADSTEGFAAMRMNRSIRSALTGRRVEEV
jgi:molecular chaperone HscA